MHVMMKRSYNQDIRLFAHASQVFWYAVLAVAVLAAPAVLNAANEIAVAAFLDAQLPFLAIASVIEHTLAAIPLGAVETLEQVLAADAAARLIAQEQVARSQATC